MQFGFKKNYSTTMCTVILREVIQNYIEGYSNVCCCLLDASKAFDKSIIENYSLYYLQEMYHPML